MSAAATAWAEANQRYLTAALDLVRAALERHLRTGDDPRAQEREQALARAAAALPAPSALEVLSETFGLSPFERDLLLLCAGTELDASIAALCASAHGEVARASATFGLALAALPDPHWSALVPAAPLRRWRLVEIGHGTALTDSPLRIDERVLHYLAGVQHLDERLADLVEPLVPPGELPASQGAVVAELLRSWTDSRGTGWPLIQLCGPDTEASRGVAAAACARRGLVPHGLPADAVPAALADQETLRRLWERESLLGGGALLVDAAAVDAAHLASLGRFLDRVGGPVLLAVEEPLRTLRRPALLLDVRRPTAAEQHALWAEALGPLAARANGQIAVVVAQFDLSATVIRAAAAQVGADRGAEPAERLGELIWNACRRQARPRLDDLAQRISPAATWRDLVLPEASLLLLHEAVAHVRQRTRVYDTWGFSRKGSRGLGITALFSGGSGTGKTMAAEVLANELRLDLYRIDLSAVVSKYIGETEKNLRRVFDAAEEGGAILFFDEADALFGKRSEVRDSHDRYANIEVSYLLQRMEAYRGLAILATNLKSALDTAFLRRIRFVVEFPFPDASQRAEIWRRIFPADTPVVDLDSEQLARLNVAGGSIRNIALNAAFLAAEAGEPVRMGHLLRAARGEYAKLEKPLTAAELGRPA
jgi:ATPase family associated with various cellular activities (AAA)/Winged helix domain, variant